MGTRQPRYSKEEFARRGQAIYEQQVRPQVEQGNRGRIVAIDIETGEFEVGDDPLVASDQLFARCPDAQPWLVRIGHQTVHRLWSLSGWYLSTGPLQMRGQTGSPASKYHENIRNNRSSLQRTYGIAKDDQY